MAQFSVNAQRFDPYKNFKFRVKWDGRYVAGVSKVSALKRSTEVVEHRDGADPNTTRKLPGRIKFEPVTLERGILHDTEFENWAKSVGGEGAASFRKNIIIDVFNATGKKVLSYELFHCWVSEYQVVL